MAGSATEDFSIKRILEILPHRFPFVMVDRIVSVTRNPPGSVNHVGEKIVCIKTISINDPYFQGHFPENPVMPGVMMVEAMAQSAALLGHRPRPGGGRWNFHLASVDNCKFRRIVTPGDVLELQSELKKEKAGFYGFHCKAFVAGELAVEAEIMARMF